MYLPATGLSLKKNNKKKNNRLAKDLFNDVYAFLMVSKTACLQSLDITV